MNSLQTIMTPKKNNLTSTYTKINQMNYKRDQLIKPQGFRLEIEEHIVTVISSDEAGAYYANQYIETLKKDNPGSCDGDDTIYALPIGTVEDWPTFERRGILLDITRGRMPKLETLKAMIDQFANFRINEIQLYMEHTMDLDCLKAVTKHKSPLTKEGFSDLDDFCHERHIELIPCIATYGHLYELMRTDEYQELGELEEADLRKFSYMDRQVGHTLDGENPKTLDLIDQIIGEMAPLYRSEYFNICGDETYDVGKGRNRQLAEEIGTDSLYIRFLNKVMASVLKHNKKPMYWADVILHYPDRFKELSSEGIPLYWWYETYPAEGAFETMEDLRRPYYACPAVAGWNRLINDYDRAYANLHLIIKKAVKHHGEGILITDWGDFGHINIPTLSMPYLLYGGALAWSGTFLPKEQVDAYFGEWVFGDKRCFEVVLKVSGLQIFNWESLLKWLYEVRDGNRTYGSSLAELAVFDINELDVALSKLGQYRKRLDDLLDDGEISLINNDSVKGIYNLDKSLNLEEVYVVLEGIELILNLGRLIILKEQKAIVKQAEYETIERHVQDFIENYSRVWLLRYEPFELNRIVETFDEVLIYMKSMDL